VYGRADSHDCLAFADADTARIEANEIGAIAACRTWGEARRLQTQYIYKPAAIDGQHEESDGAPSDEAPFAINDLDLVRDGDWPSMVTARAFRLLPQELQARFGKQTFTTLNGDYLEVPLECEAEMVAELRARQFEVNRDELINVLDGRSFNPIA
jgi:hypothetical protein